MSKENVLKVENVTMQFGGVIAVDNMNLEVDKGEIVSLIGPNGAGKTTAFNVITGVYAPTNGAVYYKGNKIIQNYPQGKMKKLYRGENPMTYTGQHAVAPTPDKITRLGIARTFQNIRLFKSQTVFENILIAKHMLRTSNIFTATFRLNGKEEARMRRESEELLHLMELDDVRDELATSLPYGKQRHLEIARALATDPKLLLLDEPAAGMNPNETGELMDTIRFVRDKFDMTILLIEHDMSLVMNLCERIYVLDYGKIIASGVPEEIKSNKRVIEAYLGEEV